MNILLCAFSVISCVFAYENSDVFINEINSKQNLWKAGRNFHKAVPIENLSRLLGSKHLPQSLRRTIPVMEHEITDDELPESFDARTHWSTCKTIKQVPDQSACGSCWVSKSSGSVKKDVERWPANFFRNYFRIACLPFSQKTVEHCEKKTKKPFLSLLSLFITLKVLI